jgi:hypothetical protein
MHIWHLDLDLDAGCPAFLLLHSPVRYQCSMLTWPMVGWVMLAAVLQ